MLSASASSSSARPPPSHSRHPKHSSSVPRPILVKSEPKECCSSVPISCSTFLPPQQHHSPPLIDISTPESLERDFHAWLKGELNGKRAFCCPSGQSLSPCAMFLTPLGNVKSEFGVCPPSDFDGTSVFQMDDELTNNDFCASAAAFPPTTSMNGIINSAFPPMPTQMLRMPMPSFSASVRKDQQMPYLLSSAGQSPSGSSQHSSLEGSPLQQQCLHGAFPPPIRIYERTVLTELSGDSKLNSVKKSAESDGVMSAPNSPGNRSSGTNQLGRTYSPGLPLSMVERQKIVELFQEGWKICDISKFLCVTHSCVSKILQRFRATGSVRPKDAKEGRQESPLVAAIRDYRLRLGIMRQSEIREQLIRDGLCRRENAPSRSSINHILRTKLSGLEAVPMRKRNSQTTAESAKRNAQKGETTETHNYYGDRMDL